MQRLAAALDLGSTSMKILVVDEGGREVTVQQIPTPWRSGAGGTTDISAVDTATTVRELILAAAAALPPDAAVEAIAAAGMGETGFLVSDSGKVIADGYAWFDPRGADQVEAFPDELRNQFAGRTGLPWGVQVSVAKILHLRDSGTDLETTQCMSLPEWSIALLGGRRVSEYSLASRTGLLDQQTGQPWPELLDYLGVDESFLPELVDAGSMLGTATADWLPPSFRGAALTVAGHDHLVAAVSGGAARNNYHVSMGTAEVLLRVLDNPLTFEARSRLAGALINCVRHVRPNEYVLVAGVKTGLIMRRALQMLGINDRAGRDALDRQVMELGTSRLEPGAIGVQGARNDDGVLKVTVRADGVSPAEFFLAILEHGNNEIQILIDAINAEVSPAEGSLLTGGWASMTSVLKARSRVLPRVRTSDRSQETAAGAALFALQLISSSTSTVQENN